MSRLRIAAMMMAVALTTVGCAPYATYPPIEVDVARDMTSPTFEPIPTLMVEAIRYTHENYGHGEVDFAWNLPRGTPHGAYTMVEKRLGVGHPLREAGERAYHVQTVRSRGVEAEVDVIYPRQDGLYELVTISFRNEIFAGGWQVKRARPWYIRVEPPEPSWVEPPTEVVSGEGST
jgi:hypothetical protein